MSDDRMAEVDLNGARQLDDRFEQHSPKPEGVSAHVPTTHEVRVTTPANVSGMGHRMKRKEDPRFIQGRGNYVDDVKLPGMLYMDIVRSPYAHAKIKSIDASAALKIPGVVAVITGEDLKKAGNLHWMPTLMSDTQMVLPIEKVVYYAQEICVVIATDRYIAADAIQQIVVDYEPLPPVVDPFEALKDKVIVRDDKEEKTNHIWHWEAGNKDATDQVFNQASRVVKQYMHIPRIHVASIETCGMVADFNKATGKLKIYMTSQAPHAHRTVFALVSGIPEQKIQIISPDIGGGFGGKVPVYPGYVCCAVASLVTGKPVKWIEDRSENLQADSFARDYHITAEMAADQNGRITGLRVQTLADNGAADAAANPSKFPAGLYSICTGSYDMKAAHIAVDGVYTNKPPGGVAYRCSFRVTEAVHMIERMTDIMAHDLGEDPADFRMKNFIKPEQFPYLVRRQARLRRGGRRLHQQAAGRDRLPLLVPGHRGGPRHRADDRHPGHQDVRLLRDPHPSHRQGHRPLRHQVAGAGPRDHLRPDRRRGAGPAGVRHRGRGRRYRHRAIWPGHLRQPLDSNRRRGGGDGRAQDQGQGPQDRRAPARGE